MKHGAWHQFGDRSQLLALEQLKHGTGVGVIISPRDLAQDKAKEHAPKYKSAGGDVLYDPQFYVPDATVGKLETYPTGKHRKTVSELHGISDDDLGDLANKLVEISNDLAVAAVVAPAVMYEAGHPDIDRLNQRLFAAAKNAGDFLNLPVYATVVLGRSITASDHTTDIAVSNATALDADGWYFAFEFRADRVPASEQDVLRCCHNGLRLAATGKPVLHAYAGLLGLLSPGFGATGVGIGHSQNLWQFTRSRWEEGTAQGGGGDAPARYFSEALWGTIIRPDETALLPSDLQAEVLTSSPFTSPWDRWQANKHLVHVICSKVDELCKTATARDAANAALDVLAHAVALHTNIMETQHITLKDNTASYQAAWQNAMNQLLKNATDNYDYLEML